MAKVSKKELKDFTDKFFGTDVEIQEGMKNFGEPKLTESVMIEGDLFSKGKWSIEEIKE